jgi:hypothetical protein
MRECHQPRQMPQQRCHGMRLDLTLASASILQKKATTSLELLKRPDFAGLLFEVFKGIASQ